MNYKIRVTGSGLPLPGQTAKVEYIDSGVRIINSYNFPVGVYLCDGEITTKVLGSVEPHSSRLFTDILAEAKQPNRTKTTLKIGFKNK